jgi:hypothetical protein
VLVFHSILAFIFFSAGLKWLYYKEDLLIFCVFSRDCSSNISQNINQGIFEIISEIKEKVHLGPLAP